MKMNDYQREAARTIALGHTWQDLTHHALFGMAGEVGEILSLYQKRFQGHEFEKEDLIKEAGDLLWFIAQFLTANNITLEQVAERNIQKLRNRYPNGFDALRSLYREEDKE